VQAWRQQARALKELAWPIDSLPSRTVLDLDAAGDCELTSLPFINGVLLGYPVAYCVTEANVEQASAQLSGGDLVLFRCSPARRAWQTMHMLSIAGCMRLGRVCVVRVHMTALPSRALSQAPALTLAPPRSRADSRASWRGHQHGVVMRLSWTATAPCPRPSRCPRAPFQTVP
jgi:Domain of unknown function (DUF4504)